MTDFFSTWCNAPTDEAVGDHTARVFASNDDAIGVAAVAAILPQAYATTKNLELVAELRKKKGVAKLLSMKVPKTKTGRSGDMGEILGTEYVKSTLGYSTGPSRLIQRDHQEWALRGDDVLGGRVRGKKVELVKVEAKSAINAPKSLIEQARSGLLRNDDLASPHSLAQFAERLLETEEDLGRAINIVLLDDGLRAGHLSHVMFILTENDSKIGDIIRDDLRAYSGKVKQTTVTVRVEAHKAFIADSYDKVVKHAT
ncbi:hypothetical protein [Arthrobacter sp. SX1312]|uniref:hypothetical protein n=1 Tax=Arthrobacter sp. SX1312 TaxID=2058896 RepID=UPI000CE491A1|nr:hypothetical protein [Arthrobacter sp. SX1312]